MSEIDSPTLFASEKMLQAAARGDSKKAVAMLAAGGDPSYCLPTDEDGMTVGHWGALYGLESLLDLLIERGWNPNIADNHGRTALMIALSAGRLSCAEKLLKMGADPFLLDSARRSAGHFALEHPAAGANGLRALMRNGWAPGQRDGFGFSAGHDAARQGRPDCLLALLEGGWDPRGRSVAGKTAIDLARENSHWDCLDLLERWIASGEEKGLMEAQVSVPACPEEDGNEKSGKRKGRRGL